MKRVKITDCPRDGIQGLKNFIPTESKAAYIQAALDSALFDCIDFGSFVSHKAMPQMADTEEVLKQIKKPDNGTGLLAIVANERGAAEASSYSKIDFLGFPFSASEKFQLRNTGSDRMAAIAKIERIQQIARQSQKEQRVYVSMAFGNPYSENWSTDLVKKWVGEIVKMDVKQIALSDTIGVAKPKDVQDLFETLIKEFPGVVFSAHLHALPGQWEEIVQVAYDAGCYNFDGAMNGFGGCPMAKDELVGNIPSEGLLRWKGVKPELIESLQIAFQNLVSYA